MTPKSKKVIKTVVDVLLWVFLAFSLLMTILAFTAQSSAAGYPKIGKKCLLSVLSDSMVGEDGFNPGDLIISDILDDRDKLDLKEGDVITFYLDITPENGVDDKVLNTHRIIEVKNGGTVDVSYQTKGDHNETADGYRVYFTDIIGVWHGKRIPVLGGVLNFLQSSTGFLVCVVIPLALFFFYELYVMIATIMKVKNKDKKMISEADEEMIKQRAIEEYLARKAAEESANKTEENKE